MDWQLTLQTFESPIIYVCLHADAVTVMAVLDIET